MYSDIKIQTVKSYLKLTFFFKVNLFFNPLSYEISAEKYKYVA